MKSPVTNVDGEFAFHKGGYDYYRDNLGNLYCGKINQADMVGGGFEVERNNREDNQTRIQRIKALTAKTNPKVLDFGCGNGLLVGHFYFYHEGFETVFYHCEYVFDCCTGGFGYWFCGAGRPFSDHSASFDERVYGGCVDCSSVHGHTVDLPYLGEP